MIDIKRIGLMGVATLSGILVLAGCETTNGGERAVEKGIFGALAGAAVGAVIGNNAGDGDAQAGALIGAIIGGAGGAYAGCRDDGGCGAQNQAYAGGYAHDYSRQKNGAYHPPTQTTYGQSKQGQGTYGGTLPSNNTYSGNRATSLPAPVQTQAINKRQYFDRNTGRYYYYDPVTRQEYFSNGERKYR